MTFERSALDVVTAGERVRWDVTDPRRPRAATAGRGHAERASIVARSPGAVFASLTGPDLTVGDVAGSSASGFRDGGSAPKPPPSGSNAGANHQGLVAFALSPSGRGLAAVYRDRTLAVFPADAPQERAARVLTHAGPVDAIAATPDGKTLAAAADGRVLVWRTDGERLRALEPSGVRALAFSPDGRTLAMGLDGAHVDIKELAGQSKDLVLDAGGAVQCLAFSRDGARLAAGTAAPSVQIFGLGAAAGEPRSLHLEAGPVRAARFSPTALRSWSRRRRGSRCGAPPRARACASSPTDRRCATRRSPPTGPGWWSPTSAASSSSASPPRARRRRPRRCSCPGR